MLIPFTLDGRRLWADLSIHYQQQVYVGSVKELSRFILDDARIDAVIQDDEIAPAVTRSAAAMTDEGADPGVVVSRVALCYGIPESHVSRILSLPWEEDAEA